MKWLLGIFLAGIAIVAAGVATTSAGDIEHIIFESGSVGDFGSPAATGWQFIETNTPLDPEKATATIEAVPVRTFQTGTNNEALVLHPWFFTNVGADGDSFGRGAEWIASAAGVAAETIDPGEIVYLEMEIFGDFLGGGQYWKAGSAIGFQGNGVGGRGFNDESDLGDLDRPVFTSLEADWIWDLAWNYNAQVKGSDRAARHDGLRFPENPAASVDLDVSYISTAIFRQGVDAATPFVGTENEVREAADSQNGGDSAFTGTQVPTDDWGGNTNVITGMVIDRAQVNLLRGSNDSPGSIRRVDVHSSYVDPTEEDPESPLYMANALIGIKMFRFGITDKTDVNLDGVTDDADRAIVLANQGLWPNGDEGATFFEGDIDNDMDVDEDDLAFFDVTARCDLNGDGNVDAADAGIMFGVWGPVGPDTPADKNGDGFVDAADAGVMFGEWTGDLAAADAESASAEYDPATGNLRMNVNGAVNVFVNSAGGLITPLADDPAGVVGLLTNNKNRVGMTNLSPINVSDFSFGSIGGDIPVEDLTLVYSPRLGGAQVTVPFSTDAGAQAHYVPEPASAGMIVLGLAGLLVARRRGLVV